MRYLKTGEINMDTETRQVFVQGQKLDLSDLSFTVLSTLVTAYPQSLTHQQLMDAAWANSAVSPETVTQRIAMIRKALMAHGLEPKDYLASARNAGYRWCQPVAQLTGMRPSRHNSVWLGLACAVLATMGAAYLTHRNGQNEPTVVVSSAHVTADELTAQGWKYLDQHNANSNALAIGLFEQALALNPQQVNALTGQSIAWSHQVTKFNGPPAILQQAKASAQLATELQPEHAQAWAALAFVDDANGAIDDAIAGYQKALRIQPDNSSTQSSLSYLLGVKGQIYAAMQLNTQLLGAEQRYLDLQIAQIMAWLGFDAVAEQWFHKADVLAPDNVFATHQRAAFYLARNQAEQGLEVIQAALQRGVSRPELPTLLALMAWQDGSVQEVNRHLQAAMNIDPTDGLSQLLIKAINGEVVADERVNDERNLWPDERVNWAQYHAIMGNADAAIKALNQAVTAGYRDHRWLQWLPTLATIRNDRRWSTLISEIQTDVARQRDRLMVADWLPESLLEPLP